MPHNARPSIVLRVPQYAGLVTRLGGPTAGIAASREQNHRAARRPLVGKRFPQAEPATRTPQVGTGTQVRVSHKPCAERCPVTGPHPLQVLVRHGSHQRNAIDISDLGRMHDRRSGSDFPTSRSTRCQKCEWDIPTMARSATFGTTTRRPRRMVGSSPRAASS
jgi:hypothetical protein